MMPGGGRRLASWLVLVLLGALPRVGTGAPPTADPLIRIGLGSAEDRVVVLSSRGGLRLLDAGNGDALWRDRFDGEVRIVLLGGAPARTVFRVQVGSFRSASGAQQLADRLEREVGAATRVHHDADRRVYRVRLGAFEERLGASALLSRMNEAGFPDAWIASEVIGDGSGTRLRLVDAEYGQKVIDVRAVRVEPFDRGRVVVNQRSYRGHVEVFIDHVGQLRAVNVVRLEDYLRGVVPDEMGPTVYPELEALKAQAVAARTYAMRNMGQFAEEGFDLCDTPRCQVYGGAGSEHHVTDRAIRETRAEVLQYGGELVNAMFTSTCGGHTEHVENVFPEQSEPYLRGVVCAPEQAEFGDTVARVNGSRALIDWPAAEITALAIARLDVLGVVDVSDLQRAGEAGPLMPAMWAAWLRRLGPVLGKGVADVDQGDLARGLTRGQLAQDLVQFLGWGERLVRLVRIEDVAVLLGADPAVALPAAATASGGAELALLVRDGVLAPHRGGSSAPWDVPATAEEALRVLAHLVSRYNVDFLADIRVDGLRQGRLLTRAGELDLAEAPYLFAALSGTDPPDLAPVQVLSVTRYEPLRVHLDGQGRVDYIEAERAFRSLTDDRFSGRVTWEVHRSRRELSDRLAGSLSIGELQDLHVKARGVSGRVADLELIGTKGSARLKGFRIRSALDVPETLFTMDRQRDAGGRIQGFTFAGKGWGHGLGMCQVGAYGMAVRGESYRDILSHYYSAVEIVRLPDAPLAGGAP